MAETSPEPEAETNSDKEHHEGERTLPQGSSRFSRDRVDSSFDEYLSDKEQRRSKGSGKIQTRRTGFSSRKRINQVSKKGKKKQKEYKAAREDHYSKEDNQKCAICGSVNNLSIHHTAKRSDGNHEKKETFITLCIIGDYMDKQFPEMNHSHSGGCHGWIEGNKSWARENGYLV